MVVGMTIPEVTETGQHYKLQLRGEMDAGEDPKNGLGARSSSLV